MGALTRRELLLTLPGLAVARRLLAQVGPEPLRARGLHSVTLAVADVERSLDFYQGLFGMPVQARDGASVLLRVGNGPRFVRLTPAGSAPPRIDHWGMAVENFDVERVLLVLAGHGVTRTGGGSGLSGGPMSLRLTNRGGTPEIHMGDPNGLVIQLQDPSYCGGSGPLGNSCGAPEVSPAEGDITLVGFSHLAFNVPDPQRTNRFYQRAFGFDYQTYQGPAEAALGVGERDDFLMFVGGGGGRGRGGAATARVNHVCLTLEGFDVERIHGALERHGIRPREEAGAGPLRHWIIPRMPDRGGAPEGTPQLHFSDPDGLSIQLQDVAYCGGGGYLGDVC